MVERERIKMFYMIAFILSLLGGILLVTSDFLYIYYYIWPSSYNYITIGPSTAISGPIIIIVGIFLLICACLSLLGLVKTLPKKGRGLGKLLSILAFLLTIIGIAVAYIDYSGYATHTITWASGAYGGFLGGLLTLIGFLLAGREAKTG